MISQSDLLSAGGSLECGVCLLEFLPSDAYTLSSCGHALHRSCLRENIVARLRAGDTAMACYESGCGLPLLDSDLSTLLDGEEGAEVMRRLARRRLERSEPSVRFCPSAGCESEVRGGSEATPELTCRVCGVGFCFLHNTAHAPGRAACAAYTARERESPENAASLAQIALNSRKCPKPACGTFVERAGGCNSIVCSRCGTTFCWLCGCEITAGELPIHYQVRACCCAARVGARARARALTPRHTHNAPRPSPSPRPFPAALRAVVEPKERLPLQTVCGHWRQAHICRLPPPPELWHAPLRHLLWHPRHGRCSSAVPTYALLQHQRAAQRCRGALYHIHDLELHNQQHSPPPPCLPAGLARGPSPAAPGWHHQAGHMGSRLECVRRGAGGCEPREGGGRGRGRCWACCIAGHPTTHAHAHARRQWGLVCIPRHALPAPAPRWHLLARRFRGAAHSSVKGRIVRGASTPILFPKIFINCLLRLVRRQECAEVLCLLFHLPGDTNGKLKGGDKSIS